MKGSLGFLVALVVSMSVLGVPFAEAKGDTLLGDGCYVIPTTSTLVKVLVGADERDGVLVSVLTSGEVWVLKTFFSLSATVTTAPEDIEICMRYR